VLELLELVAAVCALAVVIDRLRGHMFTGEYLHVHQAQWFARGDLVELRGHRYKVVRRLLERDALVLRRCWR
jgi:hypothetical protein